MSVELLERVKDHIVDYGGLLPDYTIRFFRWSDTDLNGRGSVALFRAAGTGGQPNRHVQYSDVSLFLLAAPDNVRQTSLDMLDVVQYLRTNFSTTGAFIMHPLGAFTGPVYLQNNRAFFELVIRTGTEDH